MTSGEVYKTKKPLSFLKGFLNKYGSYLLSRIVVQYHCPPAGGLTSLVGMGSDK